MIRFIVAAMWIAAVSIGSVLYSFHAAQGRTEAEPEPGLLGGLDYVRTGIVSVPLFDSGRVYGYFLARLVYTVEPAKLARLTVPAEILLMDQVYSYLYANPQIDFSRRDDVDLDMLRSGIRDSVNARIGEHLVHEVLIEQIDFLSKSEVRDNTIRRRHAAASGEGDTAAPQ